MPFSTLSIQPKELMVEARKYIEVLRKKQRETTNTINKIRTALHRGSRGDVRITGLYVDCQILYLGASLMSD